MHLGSFPQELEAQLRRARRVLLIGHQNPDADSLGSLTAFSHYADGFSGAIDMFYEPPFPPRLRFLPGVTRFQPVMNGPYDLAIVFDCGDLLHARLTRERLSAYSLNITPMQIPESFFGSSFFWGVFLS